MNKISTKYDYKSLIEDFCKKENLNKKEAKYLLRPEFYEKELFSLLPFELGELVINLASTNSALYFRVYYYYISRFFEWCAANNYIPHNPYKEIEHLSYYNLLYQMSEKSAVTVIYEYELRKYADISLYNKELYAVIIGLLYDGVAGLTELASLKWGEIDLNNGIISIKKRKINLSEFSLKALSRYKDVNEYEIEKENNQTYATEYIAHKEFLLKVTKAHYNPDITDKSYIKQKIDGCRTLLSKIGITYFDIVKSGALNALRKEFKQYNDSEFCEVFLKEPPKKITPKEAALVNKVKQKYSNGEITKFIDSCIPFLINSKYYQP